MEKWWRKDAVPDYKREACAVTRFLRRQPCAWSGFGALRLP